MPRKTKSSDTIPPVRRSSRLRLQDKDLNVVVNSANPTNVGRKKKSEAKNKKADADTPEVLKQVRKKGDTNRVEKNKKEKPKKATKLVPSHPAKENVPPEATDIVVTSRVEKNKKGKENKGKATTGIGDVEKQGDTNKVAKNNKKTGGNTKATKTLETKKIVAKKTTGAGSSKVVTSHTKKKSKEKKDKNDKKEESGEIKFVQLYSAAELKAQRDDFAKKHGFFDEDDDPTFIPYVNRYFAKKKKKNTSNNDILITGEGYKKLKKMYADVDKANSKGDAVVWIVGDEEGYEVYEVMEKKFKEYVKELRKEENGGEVDLFKLYTIVEALAFFLDGDEDAIWQMTDDGERCIDFLNTVGSLFVDLLARILESGALLENIDLDKWPLKNLICLVGVMLNIAYEWETGHSSNLSWRALIAGLAKRAGIARFLINAQGPLPDEALEDDDDEEDEIDCVLGAVEDYRLSYGPPKFWLGEDEWYETRKVHRKVICLA